MPYKDLETCRVKARGYSRTYAERHPDRSAASKRAYDESHRCERVAAVLRSRERHPENVVRTRRSSRLRERGMSDADYERMFAAQGGVCAICKQPETYTRDGKPRALCVDHCHETGRVRGLLCAKCNSGIALLGDSAERVRRAVAYLDATRGH